jgi:hypothetical protein
MSDAEIDALNVPGYKRAIYRALAHYGGFLADTNTKARWAATTITGAIQLVPENDQSYTDVGYRNPACPRGGIPCTPLTAWAATHGFAYHGTHYSFALRDVDWARRGEFLAAPPVDGTPAPRRSHSAAR